MKVRRAIAALAICMLLVMNASAFSLGTLKTSLNNVAGAPSAQTGDEDKPDKNLVGSWYVTGQSAVQGTFYAMMTFTSDGTLIADEPSAYESAGHGSWTKKKEHQAAYTFISQVGSSNGQFVALIKVVGTLTYDEKNDTWTGPFKVTVSDPSGNAFFVDTGTFSGARIKVEKLN